MTEEAATPEKTPEPTAPRPMTPKERAEYLRSRQRAQREPTDTGPKTRKVVVEQAQRPMPPGSRFDFAIDTRANAYGFIWTPDSKEGAVGFLESMRWACNKVGVDFDIKDYVPTAKDQRPTRLV
jgi:hypothetical protein